MSSFKKLSKADITTVPYAANKQWVLPFSCPSISNDYFDIYKGTFITGTFALDNYATDPITNGQYERLVYNSINHLFYQKYSSSLDTSSLMFNLNTYQSASQQRPTSSYFDYNINPNLVKNFSTGAGASIRVLAVNQDIYGSKVLPYSFRLSSSVYNMVDDGNGNIYSGSTHIGNIFYAHGLAIITNPDYQDMFPLPPIAVNNLATYLTSDSSVKIINILQNDISRSCALDTGSVVLSGSNSQYYTVNSNGTITLNYSSSGNYDVYYTVNSKCGNGCSLTSNKAKVTVNVAQVNPPACITVEFYGGKPDQTFYYVECGTTTTSSLTLTDTDSPVQRCIDGTFGVSGSSLYNIIGACQTPPPPSSYSANIFAKFGSNTTNPTTASVYYSINGGGSGSYTLLGNIWDDTCTNFGTVSIPTGSTIYVGIMTGSVETAFQASTTGSCPTPGVTSFCGTSSAYSVVMNQNESISVSAKVTINILQTC